MIAHEYFTAMVQLKMYIVSYLCWEYFPTFGARVRLHRPRMDGNNMILLQFPCQKSIITLPTSVHPTLSRIGHVLFPSISRLKLLLALGTWITLASVVELSVQQEARFRHERFAAKFTDQGLVVSGNMVAQLPETWEVYIAIATQQLFVFILVGQKGYASVYDHLQLVARVQMFNNGFYVLERNEAQSALEVGAVDSKIRVCV